MPRRVAKIISAVVKGAGPKKKQRAALARRVTQGTLLAMTIMTTQFDADESGEVRRRVFDAGLVDRLRAPLTRYHE